eukprot:966671_1
MLTPLERVFKFISRTKADYTSMMPTNIPPMAMNHDDTLLNDEPSPLQQPVHHPNQRNMTQHVQSSAETTPNRNYNRYLSAKRNLPNNGTATLAYFTSVVDDNQKLQKCAQMLFVALLVVLSFFIPLLLLQICEWNNYYDYTPPSETLIPSSTPIQQPISPDPFNILVVTLMEHNEYWQLVKRKLNDYYAHRIEQMHWIRFAHLSFEYNFDDTFDFKTQIKTPERWNTFQIFNWNETEHIQNLCFEYDGVLFIQQYFRNEDENTLVTVINDNKLHLIFDGCKHDAVPLVIYDGNDQRDVDIKVLIIERSLKNDHEIVISLNDDSFNIVTDSVVKLLSASL